jgi:hypothetical protein
MWSAGFYLTCYLACKAWPVMDELGKKKKKKRASQSQPAWKVYVSRF